MLSEIAERFGESFTMGIFFFLIALCAYRVFRRMPQQNLRLTIAFIGAQVASFVTFDLLLPFFVQEQAENYSGWRLSGTVLMGLVAIYVSDKDAHPS